MRLLSALLPVLLGTTASDPPPEQVVWVNDEPYAISSAKRYESPLKPGLNDLYAIAPVYRTTSEHAWELVAFSAKEKSELEVGGRALALVPGPRATSANTSSRSKGALTLLYAADTNQDGVVEPLTSHDRAEKAISMGLARAESADIAFFCTVTLLRIR